MSWESQTRRDAAEDARRDEDLYGRRESGEQARGHRHDNAENEHQLAPVAVTARAKMRRRGRASTLRRQDRALSATCRTQRRSTAGPHWPRPSSGWRQRPLGLARRGRCAHARDRPRIQVVLQRFAFQCVSPIIGCSRSLHWEHTHRRRYPFYPRPLPVETPDSVSLIGTLLRWLRGAHGCEPLLNKASTQSRNRDGATCARLQFHARVEYRGCQAVGRGDEGLRRPHLRQRRNREPSRLPQHRNRKNMLETVARQGHPLDQKLAEPPPARDHAAKNRCWRWVSSGFCTRLRHRRA